MTYLAELDNLKAESFVFQLIFIIIKLIKIPSDMAILEEGGGNQLRSLQHHLK